MDNVFEYKEEYGWLTNICLNVTDACNLACRYCFVEQHPHYMTLDVAKQAVHFILDNLEKKNKKFNKNEQASITFFGGEPVLMWDEIIVPLTNYIKENKFPIDLTITTNGTLLNEKRIEFMKDNNIFPLLSIDGDRETQEYNRPCHISNQSSFDLVSKNIPKILEVFPETTFRATIYADTADKMFENYLFANSQGFKNIFFAPDVRHYWNEEQKEQLHIEIKKLFLFYEFCFENNQYPINFNTINKTFNRMLLRDIDVYNNIEKKLELSRNINRCGLGTSFGAIGYDGSIYGCQEQVSKDNNIFYLGNIESGINKQLHIQILQEYSKINKRISSDEKKCSNCLLRNICTEINCPSTSYNLFLDFNIVSEIECFWHETLLKEAILTNNNLVTKNNLLFKNYLDNTCQFKNYLKIGGECDG